MTPTFADIQMAAARIAPYAIRTPLVESWILNARTGGRIFLKLETLQRTGSFKFRGACNRLAMIPQAQRANGVVAFSSGNHAQGVAAAAQLFGMPAVIVMPADAPRPKIEGTRALGARIVEYDRIKDDREAIAARIQGETGAVMVKPFDDAGVIAGQGTAGLEIVEQLGRSPGRIVVPCGGGGLASGIALAVPDAEMVIVEPERWDDMGRSLEIGEIVPVEADAPSTFCDAIMTPRVSPITFGILSGREAKAASVSDAEVAEALRFAWTRHQLVVEPGAAVALAALLSGKLGPLEDTVVVVSGGNIDPALHARIIASEL